MRISFIANSIALLALWLPLTACQTERVEYHRRPAFHYQAAMGELPDRVTLEDGTTIIYTNERPGSRRSGSPAAKRPPREDRKALEFREEHEDGTISLRAVLPQHIVSNLITCLQQEEYELIYTGLLSQHTRDAWEEEGNDLEDFIEFFSENRGAMLAGLNRIYLGMSSFETIMERHEGGVIECRLRSRSSSGVKFTRVRMISEGFGLKLLNVR